MTTGSSLQQLNTVPGTTLGSPGLMGRSRSGERRRSRSRDRRRSSRSSSRDRGYRSSRRDEHSRSGDRYKRRSRSRDRHRERSYKRQRSRSRTPDHARGPSRGRSEHVREEAGLDDRPQGAITTSTAPESSQSPAAANASAQAGTVLAAPQPELPANAAAGPIDEKRRRLEAFKAKLAVSGGAGGPMQPQQAAQTDANGQQVVSPGSRQPSAKAAAPLFGADEDEDEQRKAASLPTAAELIAARRAREDAAEAEALAKQRAKLEAQWGSAPAAAAPDAMDTAGPAADNNDDDDVDPLDAFMAGEVLPEVHALQEAERKAKEAERLKQAELLAAGKGPAKPSVLSDSDEEPEPDTTLRIPANKVKYMVGPGGATIQHIQRKSKARIQIQKEEDELNRAFGTGGMPGSIKHAAEQAAQRAIEQQAAQAAAAKAKAKQRENKEKRERIKAAGEVEEAKPATEGEQQAVDEDSSSSEDDAAPNAPPRKMVTLLLYGDTKALEIAERMIMEAVNNKEQKKKQREKEYAKKREERSRNRQLYYLRHTRDYEMLEVPVGTSKADIKKAYRKLAMLWHPDKHPNNQEEAKAKFQAIQRAYDSLMSTNEEERLEALGYKT